jgi:hypothetical protein
MLCAAVRTCWPPLQGRTRPASQPLGWAASSTPPTPPPLRPAALHRLDAANCAEATTTFARAFQQRGYSTNFDWDNVMPATALLMLKLGVGGAAVDAQCKQVGSRCRR